MSDRSGGSSIPWGSIAVVAAFVSSTVLVQHAFQPLRPGEKERAVPQQGAVLEVEARLWEDPFAAARRYETERYARCEKIGTSRRIQNESQASSAAASAAQTKTAKAASSPDDAQTAIPGGLPTECRDEEIKERRQPANLLSFLDRNGDQDLTESLVVVVMAPGNAFVGAEESRRRTRYALLAGLQVQGLSPDDAEHFGLLQFDLATSANPWRLRVPYELLSQRPLLRGDASAGRRIDNYAQVAVLWVDETALPLPKLDALAELLGRLQVTPEGWPKSFARNSEPQKNLPALAVIGPATSDGLRLALADLDKAASKCPPPPLAGAEGVANVGKLGDPDYTTRRDARCQKVEASAATASAPRQIDSPGLSALVVYGYQQLAQARLLNATATAADRAMSGLHDQKLETYVKERLARIGGTPVSKEIDYVRTMATDDKVLRALVAELQLRLPADAKRRVVLLAERDSLYAQALVSELRFRLSDPKGPNLHLETRYFYRGLDGATTFDSGAERPAAGKDKDGAALLEWPEARDQLDYLRRVAISLKNSEAERPVALPSKKGDPAQETEGGPIGAIGLLASDVHDKLLVLQALHDSFPDKVFFTTDLDARYVHPRTLSYTRNLVVASSLPLAFASPQLQAGAPPFRDVYQTSVFLAAQIAGCRHGKSCDKLRDEVQTVINQPSIYEIGRQQAVPLAGYDHSQRVQNQHVTHAGIVLPMWLVLAGALLFWPSTPALRGARDWVFGVPPTAGKVQTPRLSVLLLAVLHLALLAYALGSAVEFSAPDRLGLSGVLLLTALVTGLLLLAVLARGAMRPTAVDTAVTMPRWLAPTVGGLLMLGAAAWIAWPTASAAPCTECEPAAWLEGVSAWPSHLVHLLALVALVCILDVQWTRVSERFEIDTRWLGLVPTGLPSVSLLRRAWWRERSIVAWSAPPGDPKMANDLSHASVDFDLLWREMTHRAEPMARMLRALVWYVITLGLMTALFFALSDGQVPEVPVRGHDHRSLVRMTLYAVLALLPLLMVAVADATVLNQHLIQYLDLGRTHYPDATLQRFANALGSSGPDVMWLRRFAAPPWQRSGGGAAPAVHTLLDNWIDVRLIGRRTAVVAPLIVGPLVIVALLVVARSRLFDNWDITLPVALGICAYLVWLVVLVVVLKRAAEKARERSLRRMQADLLWLSGAGSEWQPLVEPFKRLIEEVRTNQEGAFAPLFEQPLFKGLMVPLGGIGSTQLFDYLLLAR